MPKRGWPDFKPHKERFRQAVENYLSDQGARGGSREPYLPWRAPEQDASQGKPSREYNWEQRL